MRDSWLKFLSITHHESRFTNLASPFTHHASPFTHHGTRLRLPPAPKLARRPAPLLAVVFRPDLGVALEFLDDVAAIAVETGVVVSREQIADCIGCEYPGPQRFDDALR